MKTRTTIIVLLCVSLIIGLSSLSIAAIDPKTIVGLWLFDEGAGNVAKDSFNNKLDAQLIDSPKWVTGKFGKGLEFDGAKSHVKIPDHANPTKAITISIWAKSSDPTWNQNGWLMEKRDAFILHPVQGTVNMALCIMMGGAWNKPKSWDAGQAGPKAINEWHMYTGTFDSTTGKWRIYIDGAVASEMDLDKATIAEDKGPVFIGNDTCCAGRFGKGQVDEAIILSVALDPADVKAIYTQGAGMVLTSVASAGKLVSTWADIKRD